MSLFDAFFGRDYNEYTVSSLEDAFDYFDNEGIECESDSDENTIIYMYECFSDAENNETQYEDNLTDALSLIDKEIFQLCKSLAYQNFMLMRKIDSLSMSLKDLSELVKDLSESVEDRL